MADNINEVAEYWYKKTLWIWLPFATLKILIDDVVKMHHKEDE